MPWIFFSSFTIFLVLSLLANYVRKSQKKVLIEVLCFQLTYYVIQTAHDNLLYALIIIHYNICDRLCENRPCSHLVVIRKSLDLKEIN